MPFMRRLHVLAIVLGCCLAAGCEKMGPSPGDTTQSTETIFSLSLLDGVLGQSVPIRVNNQSIEATIFGKDLGQSALFLCYYQLPKAQEGKTDCPSAIDAELKRCLANTGSTVISVKETPSPEHPFMEIIAKSPKKPNHSARFRVVCTGGNIQSLLAVTPDTLSKRQAQSLDSMFNDWKGD
jgi:hypothetical protein